MLEAQRRLGDTDNCQLAWRPSCSLLTRGFTYAVQSEPHREKNRGDVVEGTTTLAGRVGEGVSRRLAVS